MAHFLTVKDVAARLGMHPITVRRYAKQGLLTHYVLGKRIKFKVSDIEEFEREALQDGNDKADGTKRHNTSVAY